MNWNHLINIALLSLLIITTVTFNVGTHTVHDGEIIPTDTLIISEEPITGMTEISPVIIRDLSDFLDDVGFRESSGRYTVVNSHGYLGKFQFSPALLWRLGFKVSEEEFLNDPELQRQAMIKLLKHNEDVLKRVIDIYDGETFEELVYDEYTCYVETYEITKSGILAAAHLIGPYRTRLFLEHQVVTQDGYGTQITEYLYSFSGYNLNL